MFWLDLSKEICQNLTLVALHQTKVMCQEIVFDEGEVTCVNFEFKEGEIEGYFIVDGTSFDDHRGSFSRLYSRSIFSDQTKFKGIEHINLSVNPEKYTLRGFHYSNIDVQEIKVLKCLTGAIFNVTIDVREGSATYGKKKVIELSSNDKASIVVPAGCATAWMTIQPDTRVLYLVSADYQSSKERGFRFDDPQFGVNWPSAPQQISSKDLGWKNFDSGTSIGSTL